MPVPHRSERLKKDLSLFDVYAISTGAMFSSGFFLLPGLAAAQAGPAVVLAYLIAGVLILPAMFSKAELSTAMPRAGGTYYFLDRSLGPLVGTIGGLGTYLALTLKSAFALVGMGAYLAFFVEVPIKPLAVVLTVVFMGVNIVGAKETTGLQRVLVIVLLAVLAFFTVQGLAEVGALGLGTVARTQLTPFLPFGVEGLLATVGFVFVSYAGLTKVASVAEEVRNPDRNIPLGMGLSLLTATSIYVVGVFIMVSVLDAEALRSDLTPVATAGAVFFDWLPQPYGLVLIVVAAIAAFASTGNAGLMSASRYPLAMARDRLLPEGFAHLGRFQTPVSAIVVTGGLMIACILLLSEAGIAKLASAFQLFIFMLVNFAVIVMRESRITSYDPGFRSPLYPWMQVLGILAPIVLIGFMGWMAVLFTLGMAGVCLVWYLTYARPRVVRDGAIYHWFERLGRRRYEGLDPELRTILKEKGLRAEDPFDEVVARAAVLDLQQPAAFEPVVREAATHLSRRLLRPASEIAQEFMQGTRVGATPVAGGIALPHLLSAEVEQPELVLVRARSGLPVPRSEADEPGGDGAAAGPPPAHALFFLVSPKDNPGQHLRILAQIAGRADDEGFMAAWLQAEDEQQLKEVLLRDEHFLALTIAARGPTAVLAGRALRDVAWPADCLVALIRRRGEMIVPGGRTVLERGDRLTVLGSPAGVAALRALYVPSALPVPAASEPRGVPTLLQPLLSLDPTPPADAAPAGTPPRRLLVGLGMGDPDDALVRYAGAVSRMTGADEVRFVHVFRMPSVIEEVYGRPQYQDPFAGVAALLQQEVEALVHRSFRGPRGTTVRCEVLEGTALVELLRLARTEAVDLLVAGRDRQGRTLAEKLARKAPCPVLVVPDGAPDTLRRILVAVDFSTYAAEAVQAASALAVAAGLDTLHVLHVYDAGRTPLPRDVQPEQARLMAEGHFATFLEQADVPNLTIVPHFVAGENVPHRIGEEAEALDADLIVVGTRGQTSGSAVLMGSVAEELVRWARVPVLTVKRKGATLTLLDALFEL